MLAKAICGICFGILQMAGSEEFNAKLIEALATCDYEFDDYMLALTLPTAIMIRQQSIWFYLQEIYG